MKKRKFILSMTLKQLLFTGVLFGAGIISESIAQTTVSGTYFRQNSSSNQIGLQLRSNARAGGVVGSPMLLFDGSFGGNNGKLYGIRQESNMLQFYSMLAGGATPKQSMTIKRLNGGDSFVGINSPNPAFPLDIFRNGFHMRLKAPNNNQLRFGWQGDKFVISTAKTNNASDNNTPLVFYPAFIQFNSKIGIGTAPKNDYTIAINGRVRAKEVVVNTGWSDFVFESDYNLRTLEEVEAHIQNYGHLEDIPSAEEVEQNGVPLGIMDSKLLMKIEELTLYLIDQNKQIKALQQKIAELENQ